MEPVSKENRSTKDSTTISLTTPTLCWDQGADGALVENNLIQDCIPAQLRLALGTTLGGVEVQSTPVAITLVTSNADKPASADTVIPTIQTQDTTLPTTSIRTNVHHTATLLDPLTVAQALGALLTQEKVLE